ncbi:aldehyde dehydrogenase family protein [Longimicrobium terrae]|uniref:Aldehyde dehydrogenase (NAD+) n=1 Tax=Longimicrobium terrae TaxID=1639882 RepID=A0A841H2K0_9BACT|nr:aldehyde dehydrogenase family protein [Longimicrobium terrae]MBB4637909.1 aldehyde dehydrogenase (NAD+) [Longimicrobium terrae]MBB6072156.1 aldehyde dehydrogenase (NAD+) [Longimicrobium terrae]NNC28417.1 aldehyde dehydrogenase family protein [Longimicrobium terrae]
MSIAEIFETMEYGPAPESASPAVAWLEERGRTFGHFIAGEWRDPRGGEYFDTSNPADNRPLARLAHGSTEDVDDAVRAAREALPAWQALDGHARARYLYAIARHIQRHSRLFAVLETVDNGKPIRESRDIDIPLVARHFYHHAGWAQLMDTEFPGATGVGVVGQIIPWNFPLLMLAWKVAPALAMGNTVVLKPAEFTSLTALLFAEVCRDAGLPAGVLNVITGDGRTGAALVAHDDVDKIAFTGSTDVGRIIRVATAGTGKKLSLELGGKSPFLVFDDADLDSVVEGVVDAIWFNQGQVCCAGSRILAQEGIAEKLTARLRERMETLRVGNPLDKSVDIGAIVAPVQLDRIRELVEQGRQEGASLWQPSWSCPTEGCFFPPTLFTDVQPSSTVAQVEIFGPVVVLMTFRTPSEAVELANNTPYGLASSVWTENINLALDIAPKIKAGTVWINSTNLFDAAAGFGGYRESGFGREGGREGLWEYIKPRWEVAGKGSAPRRETVRTKPPRGEKQKNGGPSLPPIDRTAKLYIGGKQARPDSGYSMPVYGPGDRLVGDVGLGNRKDVRNAVEAAHKARGWGAGTAHNRAQVLYYMAENLGARADEFARRIAAMTGDEAGAEREVEASIRRLYTYAAWADKYDGLVHATPLRNVTIAMNEPIGVVGVACPDAFPLLGFISTVMPAVATGNSVVVVPSERWPLVATDFYQVLDTSDLPGGVVNIVTGKRDELAETLASHDDVEAMWYFGSADGSAMVERLSAGNMKRTWVGYGRDRDWLDAEQGEGREFLRQATQVKNVWVPYGE